MDGVIVASELHELLTEIHDIIDSALVNRYVMQLVSFKCTSKQQHEVWASQFAFPYSIKDSIPPSVACLYGYIN